MFLRRVGLAAFVLGLWFLVARTSSAQEVGPLQLTLTQVQDTPRVHFRVELHNRSERPLILNLGWNQPFEIRLSLTDAHGKTLPLELKGPPFMASPWVLFVVTLPAGGTFTLPVDLADYEQHASKVSLAPGRYTLSAEYRGHRPSDGFVPAPGQRHMRDPPEAPFWIGTAESNALPFTSLKSLEGNMGTDLALTEAARNPSPTSLPSIYTAQPQARKRMRDFTQPVEGEIDPKLIPGMRRAIAS
jgi:hypothetical protein